MSSTPTNAGGGFSAKLVTWIKRYGPPELMGVTCCYLGYFIAKGANANEVVTLYIASTAETTGFFAIIVAREVLTDRARARRRLHHYGWKEVRKTIKGLLLEFGLGQFFDSAFIRPLALGTMSRLLGPKFGLLVGKIVADVFFYAPSIIIFEMRKKMARKEAASLLSASGRDAGPDELANRVDAFAKSAVFGSVAHDDLEFFATMFDIRDLKDGEVLCHAGEKAHEVYVIKDGHVTIRSHDNAPVLARLGRSAVIGEYGMFTEAGRSATITADGSATVMTLDYDRFRRFMIAFPEGTIALLKAVVLRQVEANTRAPFAMTAK